MHWVFGYYVYYSIPCVWVVVSFLETSILHKPAIQFQTAAVLRTCLNQNSRGLFFWCFWICISGTSKLRTSWSLRCFHLKNHWIIGWVEQFSLSTGCKSWSGPSTQMIEEVHDLAKIVWYCIKNSCDNNPLCDTHEGNYASWFPLHSPHLGNQQ